MRSRSAAEASHELGFRQHVTLHSLIEFRFTGSGLEPKRGVQREEFEEIPVGLARRRTRSSIADLAEIVAALAGSVGQLIDLADIFIQVAGVGGQIEKQPVRPGSHRGIRIIGD